MKCCQWLPADRYVSQRYSVWNVVSDFQQITMFHNVTLYEMLPVTSSRLLYFTALLCMKCCQWLPADRYVSQRYSVWNVVSDFQLIIMFHSVTLYEMLSVTSSRSLFHSVTLYEMLSMTSSRSLCFTAMLCMKCCQWLPADRYVSQRYSVWNVVSDFQQIVMFHSVTLYEMLSVTSSRSLCFTALLCMKCCQWLPADPYVSQCYSVWNVVSDFQQIIMFHSVTLYEMLSVTSSRSLCFTALLCMKCCILQVKKALSFYLILFFIYLMRILDFRYLSDVPQIHLFHGILSRWGRGTSGTLFEWYSMNNIERFDKVENNMHIHFY
jgi:hypothetical protein